LLLKGVDRLGLEFYGNTLRRTKSEYMNPATLRKVIETKLPLAFAVYERKDYGRVPTGIAKIDNLVSGVPLRALTEICGSSLASSGKTSVLVSLLSRATKGRYCALIDAGDSFDPASGRAAGIDFSRFLWVRCGRTIKLPPLEQAFKVADTLLQSNGFGLIAVDIGSLPEKVVRRIPLSTWFRFSRVVEKQSSALVFVEQESHAASCAGLVVRVQAQPSSLSGKLFSSLNLNVEIVRDRMKKPVRSTSEFSFQTQRV
jgi:hypothetical protein